MKNIVDFTGKHILIVGGGSGIGRKTAEVLCKLGAEVDIASRSIENLSETVKHLEGSNNHFFQLDVSDTDSIEGKIKDAVSLYGKYDGLVYSAGVSWSIPIHLYSPDKMKGIFDINFFGFFEMVRQLSKRGRYNDGMRVVGISSTAAIKGNKAHSGYSATKAAMDGAVRSMAIELAQKNIYINTVAPGMVETELYDKYIETYGEESMNYKILLDRQFLGIGKTEDIANVIAFLLSDASRFIVGQCVIADGGYTA